MIEFWDARRLEVSECSDEESSAEAGLLAALSATQGWEVHDEDHVTVTGDVDVGLERASS